MRSRISLLALLCLLLPALVVQAQAPDAINSALNDLSQRLGHTVALNNLDTWSFEQKVFPDASLGCPKPGVSYAQVQTVGVQFILTYNGTAYDYRVSGDKTIVVLCNSAVATSAPALCPPPGDTAYLAPRLSIGIQGRVEEGGVPNNIRDLPGTSGKYLGEIPPGQPFTVVDGPRCSQIDKLVWWQVSYNGIVGWTAEGKDGDYWVEPLNALGTPAAPAVKSPITASNAAQVATVPNFNINAVVALSPDGDKLAEAIMNSIQIVSVGSDQPPVTFVHESIPVNLSAYALAFDPTGKLLAAGYPDGRVILLDTTTPSMPTLRFTMTGHSGAVKAITFSPDGKLIASGSDDATVRLWDAGSGAALAILKGTDNPVVTVSFSADGSTLLTKDSVGIVNLWRVSTTGAAG